MDYTRGPGSKWRGFVDLDKNLYARRLRHALLCAALAHSIIVLRAQSNSALSPPFTVDLRVLPNTEAPVLSWVGSTFSDIFALDLRADSLGGVASEWSDLFSVDLRDPSAAAPAISSIHPNPVAGSSSLQTITLNGTNFVEMPTVTLNWTVAPLPPTGGYVVPSERVTFVNNGRLEISIVTSTTPDTWTVKVTNPDGRSSQSVPFTVQTAGCPLGSPACGLTIITHGHDIAPVRMRSWVEEMARAIQMRIGGNVPTNTIRIVQNPLTGTGLSPAVLASDNPHVSVDSGAAIMIVDWSDLNGGTGGYTCLAVTPTTRIADEVIGYLRQHPILLSVPIHLIGHSRGASVNSDIAAELAAMGIWVDHITTLDPQPLTSCEDAAVKVWENVLFADNYYRRWSAGIPYGEPVGGTFEANLSDRVLGDRIGCDRGGTAHEQVHTYYHGTIDTAAPCVDGIGVQVPNWYSEAERSTTGYYFSRTGGGDRYGGRAQEGLHHRLAEGATINRQTLKATSPAWPNATFKPLTNYTVEVGSTVDLAYFYQDADSAMDVELFLDDDANAYRNEGNPCYRLIHREPALAKSEVLEGPRTNHWIPRETDMGVRFLQIKATEPAADGGRVRYDYLPHPITITASGQPKSDLVIENLAVSPNQALPGDAVTVTFSIRNVGGGVAYPSSANLRLNASSTAVQASDGPLALGLDTPQLLPGATHGFTKTVTLPAVDASGTYYVWVIADVGNQGNQRDTSDASDKANAAVAITVPPFGGIGDWVEVYGAGGLRVRGPEPCDLPLDGARRSDGHKGLVLDGPRPCNLGEQDYTMWWIRWADCVEGWSAQEWLRKVSTGSSFDCTRELQITELPAVGGRVVRSPAKAVYEYLDTVTLVADPVPGYYLESWDGEDEATGLIARVTMNADRAVTARFKATEPDPGCGCAIECAAGPGGARLAGEGQVIDLNLLRRFRDEVLSATPAGRALIHEFYQNSPEMLHHMAANPAMLGVVQEAIVGLQPTIRDLVEGEGGQSVSGTQVEAVTALAQQLHQVGGVVLRSAVEGELERIGPLDALPGKTSIEARRVVVGTFVRIVEPEVLADGRFQFTVIGDFVPSLRAEFSDDLLTWEQLANGTLEQLPAMVRDLGPPANAHRYYRVVATP